MNVFLYGPDSQERTTVAHVLHRRGHDVTEYDASADPASADPASADHAFQGPAPEDVVADSSASDLAEAFDLFVLVDSGEEGLALAREVRASAASAVVVFVCPVTSPEHVHRVFEAGAEDCILAPADPERLDSRFAFIEQYHLGEMGHRPALDAEAPEVQQQAAVAEIGRRALVGAELDVLMAYATRVAARVLDVELCKVLEHRRDAGDLLLKAGVGWSHGSIGEARVDDGTSSQAGFTLQASEPVVVTDAAAEDRFAMPDLLDAHGAHSGVSVVIASTPEPYGILGAHSTEPRAYSDEDVYFLQSVANVLAGAVERARTEQALRESEARASSIIETTVDGIITIDDRARIQSFNAAAEKIFGYRADEVIGKNVKVLMPQPYKEEHDGYMRSYHDTGRRRIIGIGREVTGRRKDGSTFPMDLAVSEVEIGDTHTFTGIVRDISERRRLEKEILDISEQERRRIGQDLHDGLGQMLTGIGLLSQNLTRQLDRAESEHTADAREITDLIKEADQYARDLARGLTPVDLEASGLSQALQRLADNAVRLFDVDCTFDEVGTGLVHNSTAATHMYRIAQEAVSNAFRHGRAEHIRIAFASGEEQIRLRVQDDGRGFDPDDVDGPGMGVHIMNYRARIIGATLEIGSTPGEGTTVTCTLPRGIQSAGIE